MDSLVWSGLTALVSVVTTTVTVYGWLSTRFHSLQVSHLKSAERADHLEYLINSNTALIEHRTARFSTAKEEVEKAVSALDIKLAGHHDQHLLRLTETGEQVTALEQRVMTQDSAIRVLISESGSGTALAVLKT